MNLFLIVTALFTCLGCGVARLLDKLDSEETAADRNVHPDNGIKGSVWDEDGNLVGIPTVRHEYVVRGLSSDVQRARAWLSEEGRRHAVDDPVAAEFLTSKAADVSLCAEALVKSSSLLQLSVGYIDEARCQQGCETSTSRRWRREARWWQMAATHCTGAFAVAMALYEEALKAVERPWAHRCWVSFDEERLGEIYHSAWGLLHEIEDARHNCAYPGCWEAEKEEVLLEDYLKTTCRLLDDLEDENYDRVLNPACTGVAVIPDLPPLRPAGHC